MAQRLQTLEVGNHVIAVYHNKEEKFNEALAFLKDGLQRNELIMLLTTDFTKDEKTSFLNLQPAEAGNYVIGLQR